ncbi:MULTISPECIES: Hsp20/alpha crystallin family protein [Oxalobacteraceae]|uniref:Hsp20/alpha crystallin family protein n=1 Tax=Oxalobacteraceae TaxID=75682 RepID=UPI00200052E3|nr:MULTISPECIES: Hsp20/alpha crystallin family protein [Oxalobacteraceae]
MPMPRDPFKLMWSEALDMLERANRLQRRFFQPGAQMGRPCWEPPLDIFETESELTILIALPGVEPDSVALLIDGGTLFISAERPMSGPGGSVLRRLEIPYGRFERHVDLPPGLFELGERSWANGCLTLSLRKIR